MKILVCGDRHWSNGKLILEHLRCFKDDPACPSEEVVVIDGMAAGADSIGHQVAVELGFGTERYPAEWSKFGRAAGPLRNKRMLVEGKPDLVLAFHNSLSSSKGTKNMVKIAREVGVEVRIISERRKEVL